MDLGMDVKEEPVWSEASTSHESVELVPEMIAVKQEIKSELAVPKQENEFEPSADIKGEILIEQQTVVELVPYIKGEDKSQPDVSHTDPPPSLGPACFRCDLCGKVLASKRSIIQHLKGQTGHRRFKCDHCHKNFRDNSSVLYHMRTHTGEKPYQCTVCGKSFSTSSDLSRHNRTHTGLKPHECSLCKRTFAQSGSLSTHMRLHTGEKPYLCTICNMRFSQSGHLSKHLKSHYGERPFKCSVCNMSFTQRGNLQEGGLHQQQLKSPIKGEMRKFSQIRQGRRESIHTLGLANAYKGLLAADPEKTKDLVSRHVRLHTGERPYKCSECGKSFTTSSLLTRHMRAHSGERPYKCAVCSKMYKQKTNLSRHMRSHTRV